MPRLEGPFIMIKIMSNDTLRFDIIGHVMLLVHADMPPDPDDWNRMAMVRNSNLAKLRGILVIAPPRASLSSSQRAEIARSMKGNGASTALITESALIRGVSRALAFLGVPVRAFAPAEMGSALDFLAVPHSRQVEIIQRVKTLQDQLALRHRPAALHQSP